MTVLRHLMYEGSDWQTAGNYGLDFRPTPGCGDGRANSGAETVLARLGRAIEGEVIPRLLARRGADGGAMVVSGGAASGVAGSSPNAQDVVEFVKILLADDRVAAATFVDGMLAKRVTLENICLELMSPAARRLGELWVADRCHFTDVTVALGRLQLLLRDVSCACADGCVCSDLAAVREFGRRALLVSAPGEQHTFGVLMVAEFMRRAGWDVSGELGSSGSEVVAVVRKEWFAVVGLSVSSEQHVGNVASLIHAIRRASRNTAVSVMVGGNVFLEHPDFVALVGADATAVDGQRAVANAENVIAVLPARAAARKGA